MRQEMQRMRQELIPLVEALVMYIWRTTETLDMDNTIPPELHNLKVCHTR